MSHSLYSPYILATLNNTPVKALNFQLITDLKCHLYFAVLHVPVDTEISDGDKVTVKLCYRENNETLVFTGFMDTHFRNQNSQVLLMYNSTNDFLTKKITESYRKEKARNILLDCLNQAGITSADISIPDIEIDRFLIADMKIIHAVNLLALTVESYGDFGSLEFYFDENNTFRFGKKDEIMKSDIIYQFQENTDIHEYLIDGIKTFALPIRHSQMIEINEKVYTTRRTILHVEAKNSYTEIHV